MSEKLSVPVKVDIGDIQPLWIDVINAMSNQTINPGPANYYELQNVISTYAAAMYELGLYDGYQQAIDS